MSTETVSSVEPTERDLVTAARDLIELTDSQAEAAEARGQLSEELDEAFHASGLWAMWVPRSLGGGELEPVPSLEVLEHISYGDASAGWVLMAAGLATGADAAFLGDRDRRRLHDQRQLALRLRHQALPGPPHRRARRGPARAAADLLLPRRGDDAR